MRVVSISREPSNVIAAKPSQHFTRLRAMSCETEEHYDLDSAKRGMSSADVILLPGAESTWPRFWDQLAEDVQIADAFVGIFSIDSYRTIWPAGRRKIAFDALLPLQHQGYMNRSEDLAYSCPHVFWSPACVDVQEPAPARDIDVLFWGNAGARHYPFRNFVLRELVRHTYGERVEGELIVSVLHLAGTDHQYVRLPYGNRSYWGTALYPLLSRARVCCAGSMYAKTPHPKYFENAACGCVTITNDFSDREQLGFEHGKNIWVTDESKFISDLALLLRNDKLLCEMGANARRLIAERHTPQIRGAELLHFLQAVA